MAEYWVMVEAKVWRSAIVDADTPEEAMEEARKGVDWDTDDCQPDWSTLSAEPRKPTVIGGGA